MECLYNFLGFLNIKSKTISHAIVGKPIVVISNGKIIKDALQKVRLDLNSLQVLLRKKNVFSIADVDYAIFETDGKLSVLKKVENQSVTKNDMNIPQTSNKTYPLSAVIADGTIDDENLKKLNLNKQWLETALNASGIHSIADVFYAELQKDGSLYIVKQ